MSLQMLIQHAHLWTKHAGVGVSQQAAESMGIWKKKGGGTRQQYKNKVRECCLDFAQ
jgi:hypothetical protein